MKRLITILSTALLTFGSLVYGEERVYSLFDSLEEADCEALFGESGGSVVVYLEEGTRLSIKMDAKGDFFSIENLEEGATLTVHKPFYMKMASIPEDSMTEENLQPFYFEFSHDQVEWKSFQEFFGGSVNASFDPNAETKQINFSVDVNFKK